MGHSNPVRWQYDACGRVSVVTDPLGHTVRREYDARSRLIRLYNESGELYRFVHGINGRLTEERGLDGVTTRYEYDVCDRVVSKTWAAGTPDALTHRWQYNAAGEVTDKQTPDGHTVYRYTAGGILQAALFYPPGAESPAQRVLLEYDRLGRLTAEENDSGRVSYGLDELGNRTSVQLPDGRSLKTLYYGSGHALSISLDERLITEFTRDNLHREISRTQGGLTMRTRYDRLGRQARREIYRKENGMRPAEAWHWQYDSRHNLLSETQISDYRYQGYHYDDGDRVSHHDTSFRGVTHHTYDAAGNLLTASQAGLSLKHNRQTQCGNGACRYDVYGRMVQKPGPGGLWRYGYDSEHRMTEAVLDTPDAAGAGNTRHRVTFTWDPFGRRTEKRSVVTVSAPDDDGVTVTQEVTTFVWEGFRLLGETRNGQPLVYVYEGAGSYTPLARIYGTGDKQRVDYYRCSHNGMPQALTDEDGKLHWRQDVETWGETRSEYADEEGNRWRKKWGGAPEENLRFAGQYLDRETGLHYNTFRYYAPDMGRFITPDPIGLAGGINLYQYAPNPLSWIDPLGLSCTFDSKSNRWRNNETGRFTKRPIDPSELVHNGQIKYNDVTQWANQGGIPNQWNPSSQFPSGGFNYKTSSGGVTYSAHGHGINPNAAANYPGSNSAQGPTASITTRPTGGAYSTQTNTISNGTKIPSQGRTNTQMDQSHIPMSGSPY